MVEMVEQVEIFERVVDDDFECERVEMVERGRVVDEMVDMIQIARAYEAGQKIIQTEDATLEKTVNSVGNV